MQADHDHLRRADLWIWRTIGLITMLVAGFVAFGRFELDAATFLLPSATTGLLALGERYYRSVRREPGLAALLGGTAQLVAFAAVGAPLSYIAASAGFPLQDAILLSWDRHLGFDWTAMMIFVSSHPVLARTLLFAYASFALQTLTTLFVLGFAGQLARLRIFIGAFIATTLVIIAVSAVYPAAGPWLFLDLQPASANGFLPLSSTSWPVFFGLRADTLHRLTGWHSEGIITFPSLHASLGILFSAAVWPVRRVRWIVLVLNGLLLLATPMYGSHYVVDVVAGIGVAIACWMGMARIVAASDPPRQALAAIARSPSIVPAAVAAPAAAAGLSELESA